MLYEIFQYLRNPGTAYARKLGYSKELIAIEARYKRNKSVWKNHLENSQNAIIEASQNCNKKSAVMILGAGLLYDIPLNFLIENFQKIYLVDLVFANRTQKAASNFDNITLVTHDLNGLEKQLINPKLNTLPKINASLPSTDIKPDLIVSANVLSQLHLAPIHLLDEKNIASDQQLYNYAKALIQAHIDLLKQQSRQVCLITDYIRITTDKNNKEGQESATLDIKLPTPDHHWIWEIAPEGELSEVKSMKSKVYAYVNFN